MVITKTSHTMQKGNQLIYVVAKLLNSNIQFSTTKSQGIRETGRYGPLKGKKCNRNCS
jgi:hypothetical protein